MEPPRMLLHSSRVDTPGIHGSVLNQSRLTGRDAQSHAILFALLHESVDGAFHSDTPQMDGLEWEIL